MKFKFKRPTAPTAKTPPSFGKKAKKAAPKKKSKPKASQKKEPVKMTKAVKADIDNALAWESEIAERENALQEAKENLWRVLQDIADVHGTGPFIINGEPKMIFKRESPKDSGNYTYFLRTPPKGRGKKNGA